MEKLKSKLFRKSCVEFCILTISFIISWILSNTKFDIASLIFTGIGLITFSCCMLNLHFLSLDDLTLLSIQSRKKILKNGFKISKTNTECQIELKEISTKYINIQIFNKLEKISDLIYELNKVSHCKISGNISNKFIENGKFYEKNIETKYLIDYLNNFDKNLGLKNLDFKFNISLPTLYIKNNLAENIIFQIITFDQNFDLIKYIQHIELDKLVTLFREKNRFINYRIFEKDVRIGFSEFINLENTNEQFHWIDFTSDTENNNSFEENTNIQYQESNDVHIQNINYKEIKDLLIDIDDLIKQGFEFKTINLEKYENIYKKEILDITNTNYQLDSDTKSKILKILKILKNDLRDVNEEQFQLNKESTVSALENLIIMDGLVENKFEEK